MASSVGVSVLELLHPLGYARTVRVIGRGYEAPGLCPEGHDQAAGLADLVLLAPSADELAEPGWLEAAVEGAAGSLERDGVLYILAGRSRRSHLRALLARCKLKVASTIMHHQDWSGAETMVPLQPAPIAYAFSRLIPTHPLRRRLALGLIRLPGVLALAAALLPRVGLLVQRPEARPAAAWFTGLPGLGEPISGVVVNTSWRGGDGAVLLHAVDAWPGEARGIAKTWLSGNGDDSVGREAEGLGDIGDRAGQFGVQVPRLLGRGRLGGRPFVAESAVVGEKAALFLRHDPRKLQALLTQLTEWLVAWNSATIQPRVLTEDILDGILLQPAAELLSQTDGYEAYRRQLQALASRVVGKEGPVVAAHGDLTMVNVLVDDAGRLGIIDWETGRPAELPLMDFFYAVVDAAAAVDDYRDRPAAFAECFAPAGRYRPLVAPLQQSCEQALGLSEDQVALSFHASWLKFALDERDESAKAAPDEFLQIVRHAATGRYERAGRWPA